MELSDIMEKIRNTIPTQEKNKWLMEETILEKIIEKYKVNFTKTKIKNKPGRPKKKTEIKHQLQNNLEKCFN